MSVNLHHDPRFDIFEEDDKDVLEAVFDYNPALRAGFLQFLDMPKGDNRRLSAQRYIQALDASDIEDWGITNPCATLQKLPDFTTRMIERTPVGIDKTQALMMVSMRRLPEVITASFIADHKTAGKDRQLLDRLAMRAILDGTPRGDRKIQLFDEYIAQESRLSHWAHDVIELENVNKALMCATQRPDKIGWYRDAVREAKQVLKTTTGHSVIEDLARDEQAHFSRYREHFTAMNERLGRR